MFGKAIVAAAVLALGAAPVQAAVEKQRLFVLSDIEADPDDSMSLVRLLLYSNEIDIEGLVATTSTHQKTFVAPETIRRIVGAYGEVQPNLLKHEKGFPEAKALLGVISEGLPVYGMAGVGDGKDSPGSDRLIRALETPDPRPLWVTAWGGANTLAQALYRIKQSKSPEEAKRLIAKLRVYTISDQDDSGIWIRTNFPELSYIVSPGGYSVGVWTGILSEEAGFDNSEISNAWIAEHIQQGHGPLGAQYPDVGYGMEGDTPSWLALIPNGLNAPDHPDWGGWGGRYRLSIPKLADLDPKGFTGGVPVEEEPRPIWTNSADSYTPYVANEIGRSVRLFDKTVKSARVTVWRWRKDFQNDFAARMDWTVKPYAEANHPPVVTLGQPDHITVKSGAGFHLSATGSDPDGDNLSYLWFNYPEADTLDQPIPIQGAENLYRVPVTAPVVTKTQTAHFIVKVTDKGTPPLTRYGRVIVTIEP
jgi:hypothetical protein